jgi:peptide/nickel transport system ATP-binding protein
MALLEVKNLKMYFQTMRGDVRAVDGVTFEVRKGDSLGLAGESGCGKTSAALSILRLLPWNGKIVDGSIEFDGVDLVEMSQDKLRDQIRWKRISVIFQGAMNALHPTKTVGTQIAEAIVAHEKSVDKEQAKKRGERLLDVVGVGAQRFNRYPHELSGGMKQRVMTAMALACNPELVIADEPTTALDVIIEAQVLKALKELQQKLDLSLILISHDLSMIAETCNRIAIMYAGKIVEQGDTVSIFKESLHPYTQLLLGAFPSIIGEKKELTSIHGFPPDLLNPPSGCRFHPRCPYALQVCKEKDPETIQASKAGHFVACHLVSA